ncbi:GNAT family N-acetyltransferase [Pontibacillus yanchengensis]|uniref:GNAT family N-acetyltransferase n=2 Tax=Pontibacillus yanchengensis TaxID=462910 RepID=A0ACC7VIL3_9BACI|nr:GNAT family protein [Pontibacillus yanchengensis]MYL34840.1 GNAT family N-acetyltransferase [Pontibacillus yanchengensis]MYL54786.1 GNAT family N-acetyltransferase [Pontibacillus yanchengensis]
MFTHEVDESTYLKLLEIRDARPIFNLVNQNRSHLKEWMPWIDGNKKLQDSESFIKSTLDKFSNGNGFDAAIWHKGEVAGVVGLHYINQNHGLTSIGYWLGKDFEGKGLMTKSVSNVIDYAFHTLQLNRIEIRCATENKRSQAIPERLGFTKEGVIRDAEYLYDHYVDHIVYGLLRREWEQTKA